MRDLWALTTYVFKFWKLFFPVHGNVYFAQIEMYLNDNHKWKQSGIIMMTLKETDNLTSVSTD